MPRLGLGIHEFGWVGFSANRKKLVDPKAKLGVTTLLEMKN